MYKDRNKNELVNIESGRDALDFENTLGSVGEFGFDKSNIEAGLMNMKFEQPDTANHKEQLSRQYDVVPDTNFDVKNNVEAIQSAIANDNVIKTGEIGKTICDLANEMIINDVDDPAMLNDEVNELSKALVGSDGILGKRKGVNRG